MKNRERKNVVQFYLSDDEKMILDLKYKASGRRTLSSFLRSMVVEGKVFNVDFTFIHEHRVDLSRIANNINQIARRINDTGSIYEDDINSLKNEIQRIWRIEVAILYALPMEELIATNIIPKIARKELKKVLIGGGK